MVLRILSDTFDGTFDFEVDSVPVANSRGGNAVGADETATVWIVFPVEAFTWGSSFEVAITGAGTGNFHVVSATVTPCISFFLVGSYSGPLLNLDSDVTGWGETGNFCKNFLSRSSKTPILTSKNFCVVQTQG